MSYNSHLMQFLVKLTRRSRVNSLSGYCSAKSGKRKMDYFQCKAPAGQRRQMKLLDMLLPLAVQKDPYAWISLQCCEVVSVSCQQQGC